MSTVNDMKREYYLGALGGLATPVDSLADLEYKFFTHALAGDLPGAGTGDLPSYFYNIAQNITNIQTLWTPISSLDIVDAVAGVYEAGISMEWIDDVADCTMNVRVRYNGGAWKAYAKKNADPLEYQTFFYQFPKDHPGGPLTINLEAKVSAGSMDIPYINQWVRRVV